MIDYHHDHRGEILVLMPPTVERELHLLSLVVPLVVVVVVLSFCRRQINCPYYAPKVV
jgi:hypothetical protein